MTESPILFSTAMVEAIYAGRKTQTRRIATGRPYCAVGDGRWQDEPCVPAAGVVL